MNGYQGPEHLWFLHESYFGLFESQSIIMCDSDLSSVFYILTCLENYHKDRPFTYWISYEGNDKYEAKKILDEYQNNVLYWSDNERLIKNYVKNLL